MAATAAPPPPTNQGGRGPAHHEGFFLWTQRDVTLIHAGQLGSVDREHAAAPGHQRSPALRNRLEV